MPEEEIRTVMARPVDCTPDSFKIFINLVMAGGEVPLINLQRGVPMADMLFFTGTAGNVMGVGAVRYANTNYHRQLFTMAGVPEMYNPDSVEVCWLYVKPEARGTGVWKNARAARLRYLGERPSHGVHRTKNDLVSPLITPSGYDQAGKDFMNNTGDHTIRLVVRNHDPVYNPSKRMCYR